MISSHAPLLYSSMMDAMRMRSGYSCFSRLISASIVSNGRSLMSSKFCHLRAHRSRGAAAGGRQQQVSSSAPQQQQGCSSSVDTAAWAVAQAVLELGQHKSLVQGCCTNLPRPRLYDLALHSPPHSRLVITRALPLHDPTHPNTWFPLSRSLAYRGVTLTTCGRE